MNGELTFTGKLDVGDQHSKSYIYELGGKVYEIIGHSGGFGCIDYHVNGLPGFDGDWSKAENAAAAIDAEIAHRAAHEAVTEAGAQYVDDTRDGDTVYHNYLSERPAEHAAKATGGRKTTRETHDEGGPGMGSTVYVPGYNMTHVYAFAHPMSHMGEIYKARSNA